MIENVYGNAPVPEVVDGRVIAVPPASSGLAVLALQANLASPFAIRVAATLRLADHIAAGIGGLDELAAAAGAQPDALERLLRYLTCRGVFAEPAPGSFTQTDASELLRSGHPYGLRDELDLDAHPAAVTGDGLLQAVTSGDLDYLRVLNRPAWEDHGDQPEQLPASNGLAVLASQANLAAPYAIRVAATLGLADHIASGARGLDQLATAAKADPDALAQLLRFLTARGVFTEPERGVFAQTAASELLRSNRVEDLRGWYDLTLPAANGMDVSWTGLLGSVRTGEVAYAKIFGGPVWEHLEREPERAAAFGGLMAARGASFASDVASEYDWSRFGSVVDVAGGTGVVLSAILHAQPSMRGTLVDMPSLTPIAKATFEAGGIADRADAVVGSLLEPPAGADVDPLASILHDGSDEHAAAILRLFEPLPAGADVYLLASILHDWSDEDAAAILRRCADAAGPGRRILVVDRTTDHGNPLTFTFMNLLMLVFLGGRERSVNQFARLAAPVGLTLESATPTPIGLSLVTFTVDD